MRQQLDPFEPGLALETRNERIYGRKLHLTREHAGQTWTEKLTVTKLRSYDEESGIITMFALPGRVKTSRERGRLRIINIKEIKMSTVAKKTPKASKASKASKAPKTNRHEKREKALSLRTAGKKFSEIASELGFANSGAACNAVRRAQEANGTYSPREKKVHDAE